MTVLIDQRPQSVNLHFVAGDDIVVASSPVMSDGAPFSLASYVIVCQIRDVVLHAVKMTPTVVVSGGDSNIITIHLTPSDTLGLGAGTFEWGLKWTSQAGLARTVWKGSITVERGVIA